jgi:hypothetical protein
MNEAQRNAYVILVEKPKAKRPLRGSRRRCVDRIGWYGLN